MGTKLVPSEKHYSESELYRLLSNIDTIPDRALFLFGLDSGCRVSEVATVRFKDIDFNGQIVRIIDHKKHGAIREIVVSKLTIMALKWLWQSRQCSTEMFVFPWTVRTLNRRLKDWCKRAGIPERRAHWHMLRHTFVVRSRLAGRDVSAIRAQTGDSAITLLRVYSELTPEERLKITESKPIIPGE